MKKIIAIIISTLLVLSLAACGSTASAEPSASADAQASAEAEVPAEQKAAAEIEVDYDSATSFESALNAGENLEGKIVKFTADEIHPESAFGYDIWAGEHLNFVTSENPDIQAGDTVIAKATKIENALGSWIIAYEILDVVKSDSGNTSTGLDTLAQNKGENKAGDNATDSEELPLELVETGYYINPISEYSDTAYINFCGMVHNPNKSLKAEFPEVIATAKNGDGSILGTGNQMGFMVMPDDTVTIVGTLSMPIDNVTEGTDIYFDVDWSELSSAEKSPSARTTDFTIDNISESSGSMSRITGEITNNKDEEQNVNLSLILRKGGEIVYIDNSFVDGCKPGKAKAFEINAFSEYPEHDTVEISAQLW